MPVVDEDSNEDGEVLVGVYIKRRSAGCSRPGGRFWAEDGEGAELLDCFWLD